MALGAGVSTNAIIARLNHLLQRAREVKQSHSIDPPLQVSALIGDDENILGSLQVDKDTYEIESAAKSIFYSTLVS